ncbi:hypothetical protein [Flavobacterium sp. WC2509]|uniref:hypothetical protein n=1 Tax=Flavobacterium sp. WC2509 TaxID=3461406 RepID=UPI004044E37D
MKKIASFILLICVFTNCTKDSYETAEPTNYNYYYPSDEASITAKQIGDGTGVLDPKGIAVANDKLYICNGDVLEIFNAKTLAYIKTIKDYTKGSTTIPLTRLSSVCIDNGRIYLGSINSRIFVFDEATNAGINTIGSGNWWDTFVHVFGLTVKDGLLFVKEKETTIKVLETSKITETSNWNLAPLAKLNTLKGWEEIYSMDVASGNLVVAGRDAKGYLYYNIADIRKNATNSLTTPITPTVTPFTDIKPTAVAFSTDWAVTSENADNLNYLRIYPKEEFISKTYNARINASDIMGANAFGSIVSIVQLDDRLFLADNTNQKIRIIKLNKSTIAEQK